MTNHITKRFAPVVIVGGGVVGATTAILLAKKMPELPIMLIDAGILKENIQSLKNTHDSRVFALNPASIQLLKQAGIWSNIARKADYEGMQVWSTNGAGEVVFGKNNTSVDGIDHDVLGSMVEPQILLSTLHTELTRYENIELLFEAKISYCDNIADSYEAEMIYAQQQNQEKDAEANHFLAQAPIWQLRVNQLDNKQDIFTPLVIACDGRNSFIRNTVGFTLDTLDYKKIAISCAIKTQKPHESIARQIFLPSGPLALLPLADICEHNVECDQQSENPEHGFWSSIVWTLPDYDALSLLQKPQDFLAKTIAQNSQYVLGDVIEIESVASFPLSAQHVKSYVKDGLVLVGDAAHGVHPLAGQGLNLGLLDVAVLTDEILSTYYSSNKTKLADLKTLKRYEKERKGHNATMMHSFSIIGWMFEKHHYPASHLFEWLRSESVQVSTKIPMLNRFFAKKASGLDLLNKTRW